MKNFFRITYALVFTLGVFPLQSQRLPVLKQISLPHDYYFRELYLPQLTSGPGSVAWSPDGKTLVYSMGGFLWKQNLGEDKATQLTDGGYDFQPDWSPDGKQIIFTRYTEDAMELFVLDLATSSTTQLTSGHAVNVEPRFSPDGKRIAFVSTQDTGHFRIWIGNLNGKQLTAHPLSPERISTTSRYYYSQYDHQLSPSWSPDGKFLLMVSNPEVVYGTGNIYRVAVDGPYEPQLIQKEETSWKTKPDWCRDGQRIVYASYLGRQWHQLWLTSAEQNNYPYPMSYGNYEMTSPRWSPDGSKIAYISNQDGNTALWLMQVQGGVQSPVTISKRQYLHPMGELTVTAMVDGKIVPCRISITDDQERNFSPEEAWVSGDDSFDRSKQKYETHYFHSRGEAHATVPTGKIRIRIWRGLEQHVIDTLVNVIENKITSLTFTMKSVVAPSWSQQWVSGDVHVHMNYGGHYRNTPTGLVHQAQAEDLDVVFNTIVNKEQRIMDYNYFTPYPDPDSEKNALLLHAQEHHTSYWGHMGLLGLDDHFLLPGYSRYLHTAIASPYPTNAAIADAAHAQHALVGYVHPFYDPPNPGKDTITSELPIDVALGKIDYYEVLGFSWHKESASVWYRLLNCGFHLIAAGGTDAMANYASLRGPVGMNRVYVHIPEPSSEPTHLQQQWLQAFKEGKTMATNGPLLGLDMNGLGPGGELAWKTGKMKVKYTVALHSMVPVDHLELIQNGEVVKEFKLSGDRTSFEDTGNLTLSGSSWLLLRAWNDDSDPRVLDIYPYATTNPIYFVQNNKPVHSAADAEYFVKWIDNVKQSAESQLYLNESERQTTLSEIQQAREVFARQLKK